MGRIVNFIFAATTVGSILISTAGCGEKTVIPETPPQEQFSGNVFDYIADPVFNDYCRQFDTDEDGVLTLDEAAAVAEINLVFGYGVDKPSSLAGLEYFVGLEKLNSYLIPCGTIDVAHCPKLKQLGVVGNELTTLDVSRNPELLVLNCGNNVLTELDLSGNPKLVGLGCGSNRLTALDISTNIELLEVQAASNSITELDVSRNEDLKLLFINTNQFQAEAIRDVFADLPLRMESDYPIVNYGFNPGTDAITEADRQVATDKNWRAFDR